MRTLPTLATLLTLTTPATALPPTPTIPQLLDLCASASIAEATIKGDRLGWTRIDEPRIAPWRRATEQAFGPVDVVGWARGQQEDDGLLSVWAPATEPTHSTCSYQIGDPTGLLDALSQTLGDPSRHDTNGPMISADWTRPTGMVSFVQIGSSALITRTSPP